MSQSSRKTTVEPLRNALNRTDVPNPRLASLFEAWVARTPMAPAIVSPDAVWTYQSLNAAANRLANALLARPPSEGATVVIVAEPEINTMIAVLGCFKAQIVFAVLDVSHSDSGLKALIENARAELIITDHSHRCRLDRIWDGYVMDMDAPDAGAVSTNPTIRPAAQQLAYLRYTSGSTGSPKGVMETEANIINAAIETLTWWEGLPDVRLGTLAQFWPTTTLVPLMAGLSVHPYWVRERGFAGVGPWLDAQGITVFALYTAGLRQCLSSFHNALRLSKLRMLILTGEAVTAHELKRCETHFPPTCEVMSMFASTECPRMAVFRHRLDAKLEYDPIPAGFAMGSIDLRIENEQNENAAEGELGEVVIQSQYLPLGYWGNPTLTAKTFQNAGRDQVYRTGDVGRIDDDGLLHIEGRRDQRIKIRGYQLYPEQIEANLLAHETVQACAVGPYTSPNGDIRLAAYVVPASEQKITSNELRAHVAATLPHYMVPVVCITLDELPKTTTGKIDRTRLPVPQGSRPTLEVDFTEPRNEIQRTIRGIWERVLGVSRLGVNDPYYDVGGDSLSVASILTDIEAVFGVVVAPSKLVGETTIAELADQIESQLSGVLHDSLVCLRENRAGRSVFWVHCGRGSVNHYRGFAASPDIEGPMYAFEPAHSKVDLRQPRTVEAFAKTYVERLLSSDAQSPYILGGYSFGGLVAYEMARLLLERGLPTTQVILLDTPFPSYQITAGKLRSHLRQLSDVHFFPHGLRYIAEKISGHARNAWPRWCNKIRERCLRSPRDTWTADDAGEHFFRISREASARYVPKEYDGEVTLFEAELADGQAWRHSAKCLAVVRLDCLHEELLQPPHAGLITRHISDVARLA